jgi:hypothetical protein
VAVKEGLGDHGRAGVCVLCGRTGRGMGRVRGEFLLVQWMGGRICWFSDRVHV